MTASPVEISEPDDSWTGGSKAAAHPLPQLAREFGITREQARDRIHKARTRGYLTKGKQGRAGANPGRRPKSSAGTWAPDTRTVAIGRGDAEK